MKKLLSPARSVIAAALIAGLAIPAHAQLREALATGEQATRKAEQVQDQINQLDDQRSDMVREYRTLLQRRDAAELFAKQQELVVQSQREEIASLENPPQLDYLRDPQDYLKPRVYRVDDAIWEQPMPGSSCAGAPSPSAAMLKQAAGGRFGGALGWMLILPMGLLAGLARRR